MMQRGSSTPQWPGYCEDPNDRVVRKSSTHGRQSNVPRLMTPPPGRARGLTTHSNASTTSLVGSPNPRPVHGAPNPPTSTPPQLSITAPTLPIGSNSPIPYSPPRLTPPPAFMVQQFEQTMASLVKHPTLLVSRPPHGSAVTFQSSRGSLHTSGVTSPNSRGSLQASVGPIQTPRPKDPLPKWLLDRQRSKPPRLGGDFLGGSSTSSLNAAASPYKPIPPFRPDFLGGKDGLEEVPLSPPAGQSSFSGQLSFRDQHSPTDSHCNYGQPSSSQLAFSAALVDIPPFSSTPPVPPGLGFKTDDDDEIVWDKDVLRGRPSTVGAIGSGRPSQRSDSDNQPGRRKGRRFGEPKTRNGEKFAQFEEQTFRFEEKSAHFELYDLPGSRDDFGSRSSSFCSDSSSDSEMSEASSSSSDQDKDSIEVTINEVDPFNDFMDIDPYSPANSSMASQMEPSVQTSQSFYQASQLQADQTAQPQGNQSSSEILNNRTRKAYMQALWAQELLGRYEQGRLGRTLQFVRRPSPLRRELEPEVSWDNHEEV
ncbi:uncharacterized protein SCHCODRAFT_02557011 [Schizophyllum commune H4-8]|nr:uncharacterized protein SCHCODRAFT_02557011 [Schizophyllum commune H4-8]KAI5885529.1 hypothetical protein SCHCODRAFT_02557011 [Schizophyllum commune H4-8]